MSAARSEGVTGGRVGGGAQRLHPNRPFLSSPLHKASIKVNAQGLNQLLHAHRVWQIILVPQHKHRDPDQRLLRQQLVQLLLGQVDL